MKTTIYANYGVLAHEKQMIYTTSPETTAKFSEPVIVTIPEKFKPYETECSGIAVMLPDQSIPYLLSECLSGKNDKPILTWYDATSRSHSYIELERD